MFVLEPLHHKPRRMPALLATGLCWLGWSQLGAAESPLPSVPAIASKMNEGFGKVRSLYVSVAISNHVVSNLAPHMTKGGGDYNEADEFALSGDKYYRRRQYWMIDRAGNRADWHDETETFDGNRTGEFVTVRPVQGPARSEPATIVPYLSEGKIHQANPYMEAIGSFHYDGRYLNPWIFEAVGTPAAKFSLPEALSDDCYRLMPQRQTVGDSRCVLVVCGNRDKVWLNEDRGFAVAKREWNWVGTDAIMLRMTNSRFAEPLPGLWLPKRVSYELWAKPADWNGQKNLQMMVSTCDVAKLTVNEVADDLFAISVPAGTDVLDASLSEKSESGYPVVEYRAGATPEQTQANLDAAVRRAKSLRGVTSEHYVFIIVSVLVLAAMIVLGAVLRARRKRGKEV